MRNRIFLTGRVGADPEVKNFQNGMMTRFTLATWENYKDQQGEKKTITAWHKIVCWGKLAEWVQKWIKKGQLLDIEGKLVNTTWEDKNGIKHYETEIQPFNRKDSILFVSSVKKPDEPADAGKQDMDNQMPPPLAPAPSSIPEANFSADAPDDLPF